jgi:proteasome activator subunit 4
MHTNLDTANADQIATTSRALVQQVSNQPDPVTGRTRPRTYDYLRSIPYKAESREQVLENLNLCLSELYIAVAAGDFTPGAVHWTREIRGWLGLKFDMPRDIRVKLVQLYYALALAPGLDNPLCERFASMFMFLTK